MNAQDRLRRPPHTLYYCPCEAISHRAHQRAERFNHPRLNGGVRPAGFKLTGGGSRTRMAFGRSRVDLSRVQL